MKTRTLVSGGIVVFACVVAAAVWIGTQSGSWRVIHNHSESLTIPASWHAMNKGKAYLESLSQKDDGLWLLPGLNPADLPATAKLMPKVGNHIKEWQVKKGNQFTYYGLWTDRHQSQAIKIHVPRSQQNLALAVLGSWRPSSQSAAT